MKVAYEFAAELREKTGTGAARALRREGRIPAALYSEGKAPKHVSLPLKDVTLAYHKGSFMSKIVSINVGKDKLFALPKEVQTHPVTDVIEHADFYAITEKSTVTVKVPVKFLNVDKSVGLKRGGVLNIVRHDLELICRPDAIPSKIEIDVLNSNIGDSIHINAVALPDGVTSKIKRNFTIATIAGRSKDEPAAEAAAAAPAAAAAAPAAAAAAKPAAKK